MKIRLRYLQGTVSTDDILPAVAKHMSTDVETLAAALFRNYHPQFGNSLRQADVIVCDAVFGIGSSREQAPHALRAAGVRGVLAPEFGAIFYRNAWNSGLFAIRCALPVTVDNQPAEIDIHAGWLRAGDQTVSFPVPGPTALCLLASGGLLPHIAKHGTFPV